MKEQSNQDYLRRQHYKSAFVYTITKPIRFRRRLKIKKNYLQRRYIYHFYLILSRKRFIRFRKKMSKKYSSFEKNYMTFLEARLFMMIYRSNIITNIFQLKYIIDLGLFLVNGIMKNNSNTIIYIGDIIHILPAYVTFFRNDFILRLKKKIIVCSHPNYLFFDFAFMYFIYWHVIGDNIIKNDL
jgi:ribosomal protein S4